MSVDVDVLFPSSHGFWQSFADVPFTSDGVETRSFLEASDGLVQLFGESFYMFIALVLRTEELCASYIINHGSDAVPYHLWVSLRKKSRFTRFWGFRIRAVRYQR